MLKIVSQIGTYACTEDGARVEWASSSQVVLHPQTPVMLFTTQFDTPPPPAAGNIICDRRYLERAGNVAIDLDYPHTYDVQQKIMLRKWAQVF
jgi:hypothetical protein